MSNDNKTLADVQPGGRVRLATVPYDRAHDLIGDAYNAGTNGIGYSQQIMELHDAIIPAQPSQVAYHGDVDLKWLSGSIGEVAHRLSTYMPTGLAEWADRARDCRIAAQVLSELSAQPSPGGQGEALHDAVGRIFGCDGSPWRTRDVAAVLRDYAALAARQPVGEPVSEAIEQLADDVESCVSDACGYLASDSGWDDYGIYRDDAAARYRALPNRIRALAAPPVQAVDLEQFRPAVELMEWQERGHANPDFPSGDAKKHAEALRLLALIDSQAVGNGPSGVPA